MKVVEYINEDPARALAIEHLDESVAVPAESVERECPLTSEETRGVRKPQIDLHEIGTVTVTLLDTVVGRGKVRSNRTLVAGMPCEMRSQQARLVPVELHLSHAKRLHDRRVVGAWRRALRSEIRWHRVRRP